ncbi:[protein-PII] uridylyltransferase [Amaricoccus tamworthensis]|uniref:[protein-PII] uridylyltransferase n=1 Tax=Amaricoccus tamworthensis TaxID=57002 RepID=UPI003C7DD703
MPTDQTPLKKKKPKGWKGLFSKPKNIFDVEGLIDDVNAAVKSTENKSALRQEIVPLLQTAYQSGRDRIREEVLKRPLDAHRAIHDYSWLTDRIVTLVLDVCAEHLHPRPNPTASEHLATLAVGGYGRGEMAPYSDVDLLFLIPYKQTAWGESLVESVLYILWDLKLKVGHSVRTIDDCIRLAKTDVTIRTTLLETRRIWGSEELSAQLDDRIWPELFEKTGTEFVELKLEERDQRHKRQGTTRYLLEPNVKESKGGLRDLQTLIWIAKYLNHADTMSDLVRAGVFSREEADSFAEAEAFLWTTRVNLHLLTNRATEQLTFDTQVELAERLGYTGSSGQQAVERYMQDYFRHAKHVGDLTRIFLAALEARHAKPRPNIRQTLRHVFTFGRSASGSAYRLKHGRIDILDADRFLEDPVNILRLFREGLTTGIPVHPDSLRLVAANLDLIDDNMRNDPEANRIFLQLLLDQNRPERELRLMNEVGVLGRFIPEFGRIVAMMQFNMYHHYTVDEHTIQVIAALGHIEQGDLVEEIPMCSAIMSKGVNRRVLYVALLLHDIGKGSDRDHSEYGAEIATELAPRLGLTEAETELVVWLVENHLIMSDTAQRRDLTDPRTVRDFAKIVKSPMRLKLLFVLTVCDIRGVGPGVWNNWKATLLRTLYSNTLEYLSGGQSQDRPERERQAQEELAEALDGWTEEEIKAEWDRHYSPYWLGFDTRTHKIFANLLRNLPTDGAGINIELDEERDATQVCFAMADHIGIFTRLTGALAIVGANTVDARSYTTSDGNATAAFWIQDSEGKPYEQSRISRLRRSVRRILEGEVIAGEALREKDRIKPRESRFVVPTQITFDNTGSDVFTIIEVETFDRPGLLYDICRTLTRNNIPISSLIIATYGKQAVDVFYVKDIFGLKLHAESKRNQIEKRLLEVINAAPGPDP